ncbi:MAG: hypothetical protein VYB65_05910 [Myxococcota bacterium]|nr:hypothetical protein [Myxococcota bacterium]
MDDHTDHEQPAAAEDERSLGRKLLRTGLGALLVSESVVREVVKELPAEAANRLMQGTKDTKNEVMRLAGNEVKNFLEHLDLVGIFSDVLERMDMEVELKVKFTRNEHGELEPQVEVVGEDSVPPEG